MAILSQSLVKLIQLATRVLQWCSVVIVMGITSYFINKGPHGQHIIYQEIISTMSVVFFLPAFISPFFPTKLGQYVFLIDVIFSYLWLTAFIFSAQDYNWHSCSANAPPGMECSRKKANESFIFLSFIFTFLGMFLEILALWSHRNDHDSLREKQNGNGTATAPPVDAAPAPAETV